MKKPTKAIRISNVNTYKIFFTLVFLITCTSCQKKYKDNHTKDEVIIEFAARLEEHSPKYQYDHSQVKPLRNINNKNNHAD